MAKEDKSRDYDKLDTSATFIGHLKDEKEEMWSLFYDSYSAMIINFAKKRGCSKELSEDVLQETAMALFRYMPNFEYDREKGRFRSFLFKITESKIIDAFRRSGKLSLLKNSEIFDNCAVNSEEEFVCSMHLWDEAWEEELLSKAAEIVRKKVQSKTFNCFEKVFMKGLPAKEVADEFGINTNLVYQHKHKVFTMIVDIAKKLLNEYSKE